MNTSNQYFKRWVRCLLSETSVPYNLCRGIIASGQDSELGGFGHCLSGNYPVNMMLGYIVHKW